jgi:hypothetical protein
VTSTDFSAVSDALRKLHATLDPLPADGFCVSHAWDLLLRRLGGTDKEGAARCVQHNTLIPESVKVSLLEVLEEFHDIYHKRRNGELPATFVAVSRYHSRLGELVGAIEGLVNQMRRKTSPDTLLSPEPECEKSENTSDSSGRDGLRRRLKKAEREPHVAAALRKLAGFDVTKREWPVKYYDKIRAVRVEEVALAAELPGKSSAATTDTWRRFELKRKQLGLSPASVQGSKKPLNLSDTRLNGYETESTDDVLKNADRNEVRDLALQGQLPYEDLWERILEKSTLEEKERLERMSPAERQHWIGVYRQQLND